MTGNANLIAKDIIRKLDFLKYDVIRMKDDIDIYKGSQALDFTEYDQLHLKKISEKMEKISEEITGFIYTMRILSGN